MGLEANCVATHAGRKSEGKAHLDSNELKFSGEFRLKIPLNGIRAEAKHGELIVESKEGRATFALGKDAEKWALKIRYPKSRIEKLGVKAGHRVSILGIKDEELENEIASAGAQLTKARKNLDFIFFGTETEDDLVKLSKIAATIIQTGVIWIVYPKGIKQITEAQVRSSLKTAGLVDTKVCAFSETHTALKAVIPVANRIAR